MVVPVYRAELSEAEHRVLARLNLTLAGYPRVAAGPPSLFSVNPSWLSAFSHIEVFPEDFFASVAAYNRLMLSDLFYRQFESSEFILIHQLDAWIFRDELRQWCDAGFDYVGAPWIRDLTRRPLPRLEQARQEWIGRAYRRLDIRDRQGHPHRRQMRFVAGNGGFSLRRVEACARALVERRDERDAFLRRQADGHPNDNEDVFFSLGVNRQGGERLRIPDVRTAARFSLEKDVGYGLRLTDGKLPFGCHAWERWKTDWQRYAPNCGLPL